MCIAGGGGVYSTNGNRFHITDFPSSGGRIVITSNNLKNILRRGTIYFQLLINKRDDKI